MNSFYLYLGFDRPIHPEISFAIIQFFFSFFQTNIVHLKGQVRDFIAIIMSVFRIFHSFFRDDLQYIINCNFSFNSFQFPVKKDICW